MSYAQRREISGNRTVAIVIVALIHAVLGYAIVTGLAYNVIKQAAEDLKTFNVEEEPPPPPEEEPPPPPPENVPQTPPPVVSPPPIVRTNIAPPPVATVREAPPPVITPTAPAAPPAPPAPPPPPPPPRITKAQSASGNLQGLFTGDDYPPDAIRNEDEGTVTVSLAIGTNGRVTGCNVTGSSGSRSLDSATCRILRSRARFTPARLSDGTPTTDNFTQRITWRLQ